MEDVQEKEMLSINGEIEHIIYQNEENGYTVCEMNVNDEELITAVGIMPYVGVGETIEAKGTWTVHASFGRQFKIEYFEKKMPVTTDSILKYLSSRTIKGIGPKTAKAIVDRYGEDSLNVIENHPQWLADLPGITLQKAKQMQESFQEQFGVRSVMMFFREFFGPSTALRIYKRFGGAAIDVVQKNPYILCSEAMGIGFEKADKMAASLKIPKDAPERVGAGIEYVLTHNANQNGHVFIPQDKLIPTAQKLLGVDENCVEDVLESLVLQNHLKISKIGNRRRVYLSRMYDAEKYIAAKLDLLDKGCPEISNADIALLISKIEAEEYIQYAKLQREAIERSLRSGVTVLTGGPGTGKTTVIHAIIRIFSALGFSTVLAAPTGRAAKRMGELTGVEAKTIHRLLEMEYSADEVYPIFRRNEDCFIEEEVIILDEASMIDTLLMSALLHAIKPGSRLIIIGDSDQLPSVGAGSVLHDIIESDRFSTIKLTEIFRQAKESLIVINAHRINAGVHPELDVKNNDFFFISRPGAAETAANVVDLYKNRLPKRYGEGILNEIQVITPSKKSEAGTESLNMILQEQLNPPSAAKKEKTLHRIVFREGDRVMQIRNNYDIMWKRDNGEEGIGIFNGDIGWIKKIDLANEVMQIDFDEKHVEYEFAFSDDLDHAYAITIHKSQGSEYPVVIIPIYRYTPKLLTRNLIYTAVTRARDMVILVGEADVLYRMVDNNTQTKRYTGLIDLLNEY